MFQGNDPFDYYTRFISYSSHDQRFVENLYRDLRKAGVLCWYAPESLNAGEKFPAEITEAVQSREKLIVVLSKYSLGAIFGSSAHLRDAMCPNDGTVAFHALVHSSSTEANFRSASTDGTK